MKAYLLSAVGVIFLTVTVSFIVPEGKLKKSVNFILRLVSILIIVQPAAKIFNFTKTEQAYEYDYNYICSVYSQNQSRLLTEKVEEQFGLNCACVVEIIYNGSQIMENGVSVEGNFESVQTIEAITEYLQDLGYINITVNEKSG